MLLGFLEQSQLCGKAVRLTNCFALKSLRTSLLFPDAASAAVHFLVDLPLGLKPVPILDRLTSRSSHLLLT